jgi:NADH-quinone oxidoreductase subunit N
MTPADLSAILPELALAVFAMAALMFGAFAGKDDTAPLLTWLTAGVFAALALYVGIGMKGDHAAFGGLFIDDAFARFAKITILLSAAAVLLISKDYMHRRGILRFEFPILVALAVTGMMMMVSAGDLMALYMGLELQSLALYVLAAMRRDSVKSTEAGLKYFVLGALSSGLLLYGASLTYGYAGTTLFSGILATLTEGDTPLGLLFGLVFMLAGLAFKVSAAPFHMWTPDVYEGAPTPITAFFATAPKVAAMALLARLVHDAFGGVPGDWGQILAALAVVSMFLGAVAAIGQRDIKRLMAYSSIAHMGYALVGLAAGTAVGVQAMLLYMAIYVTMNIGTFAFILSMERDGKPVTSIESLNMFSRVAPGSAGALAILMFSLAGVPPMLGFFGKFYVLNAAVDAGMVWLAVAGAVASVIGAYYYLRIVFYMYFGREGEALTLRLSASQQIALAGAAAIMLLGIVNVFGLEPLAALAAESLVR